MLTVLIQIVRFDTPEKREVRHGLFYGNDTGHRNDFVAGIYYDCGNVFKEVMG